MRRRAKPAKAKVEAKLPAARKSRNNQGSKVRDLEKRLRRETAWRERAERALLETLDRQRATGEILQVISRSSANAQPVFDAIVNAAARLLRTDGGILTRIVGDLIELAAFTSSGPSGDEVLKAGFPVSVHDSGSMQAITVRDQAPFVSADFVTDGRLNEGTRSRLRVRGFRSGVAVPLLQQGIPIGAISITRRDPGAFTPDEIALLQTFADQAVIAIENVRLFTELQEKNRALTHAHAQVTEALEQQTATAEVLKVISRSTFDLQPVLDTLIENAARLCASQRGVIMRRDGDSYHGVAFYNVSPELTDFIKRHPITPGRHSITARVALERRTIHVADLQADPEYRYALRDADPIRTELGVPIFRGDDIVGVIILHKLEVQPFTDTQIELVETFADQAVIAIENVRLFKELQERNRDLTEALEQQTATSEILRVISSSPTDVQPVFDTIVRSTVKLCDGLFSALYRFDGELIHHVAQHNYTPEALEAVHRVFPARPTRALGTGRAILERAVVHIPDVEGDPEYLNQALTRAIGFRSGLFVPMRREGAPIGVIVVARADPGPFSDSEIALLQTFADQAVIAIENVRLFTELQEKNRDLTEALDQQTATSEILRVIGSSPTDVQPVFDTIARSGVSVCAALGCAVFVVDGDMLRVAATHGVRPERVARFNAEYPKPLAAADDDAARTILERSVFHLADIEHNPNATAKDIENARLAGYRTRLMVPMVRGTTALGLIAVTREAPTPFSDQQVELLKTFADQAVIAIENVRLFKELGARNNELRVTLEQQTATSELLKVIGRSTFDLKPVFETLAENAVRLCEAEHAFIFGFDGQVLRSVATYNIPPALKAFVEANPIRPGRESGAARAAMERRTVHIEDIQTEAEYTYGVTQVGPMRTLLAIPMLRADELLGVIVITRPEVRLFTDGQIALMETFADQAAIAIENARLFREIEHKSRQLEVASQHKSEFLANMSHELRTPLNAIIGFSEVLTERMFGELNEKQDEYLKDIYASGQHLLSLINDILDLSKIEAGRMELEVTDFHLPAALDNALTLVRERAARRGIALQTNVDERLGEIQADERKIRQVVLNLLSNAIKFTPEGGRIEVGAVPRDGSVEVSVSDTGIGIAPEDQEAVFEEFRQVGTAEKKAEGTGLGLTLCRKFVELHGGKIGVTSEVGVGSTFTFTIPVRRGE